VKVGARIVYPGGEYARTDLRVAPGEVEEVGGVVHAEGEPVVVLRTAQIAILLVPDEAVELATALLFAAREHRHEGASEVISALLEQAKRLKKAREAGEN
jgi:hypothetical protein